MKNLEIILHFLLNSQMLLLKAKAKMKPKNYYLKYSHTYLFRKKKNF